MRHYMSLINSFYQQDCEIEIINEANKVIEDSYYTPPTNVKERMLLAGAHYAIANQSTDVTTNRIKMHLNSAISILNSINERDKEWAQETMLAYYKRAQICEVEQELDQALYDYKNTVALFPQLGNSEDQYKLLLAHSCLSIADVILYQAPNESDIPVDELFKYINISLSELSQIKNKNSETWSTAAYAHQTAGIALGYTNFESAVKSFDKALMITFKAEPELAINNLSDIYTCLSILHHNQLNYIDTQPCLAKYSDQADLYYSLAKIFSGFSLQDETTKYQDCVEIIDRLNSTDIVKVTAEVQRHVIDAMIYVLKCIDDGIFSRYEFPIVDELEDIDLTIHDFKELILKAYENYFYYDQKLSRLRSFCIHDNISLTPIYKQDDITNNQTNVIQFINS